MQDCQKAKLLPKYGVTQAVRIDQYTALYGVVGFPLKHTLGPIMHNTALRLTDQNAVYLAFETEDIEGCLRGMRALGIRGMSVTIPHKSAVIPYLDEVDPLAKRIGAVNTILNNDGRLIGYNTDALGAYKALEKKIAPSGKNCLIFGAGGAARAVGFILNEKGVKISVVNRSQERGKELALLLGCQYKPLEKIGETRADFLIQTTPVGMYPSIDRCIVPEGILEEGMVVMDIVYNPLETRLLKMAKSRGCVTINGLSMFINQGAEQFRLWTGINPPMNAMSLAVERVLSEQND